jgi:uncharacterized protein (TIGR02217 family)
MTAFFEGRLPLALTGASGGPERRTDIVTLGSGREQRNAVWAHGRRRYDIAGAVTTPDELHMLIAFFEARRGRLQGFRWHDAADGKSCAPSATASPFDQSLGAGDGAQVAFPLRRAYGAGADTYWRPIAKPVAGSVRVAVDGVELAAPAFAVDTTTGVVTLAAAPAAGKPITAGFAFDTPVRFDTDRIDAAFAPAGGARVASIALIEILI